MFEAFLVFCLFITLVSIRQNSKESNAAEESSYGPTRKYLLDETSCICSVVDPIIFTIVPRKPVIFGNTAGFGPDIDYQDPQMLLNATRMREIHKNWHNLFPREFS